MLNAVAKNVNDEFSRELLVEEVIKYRIKKYGNCGLKLIFTTIAGDFYKDEAITKFDGSLINTCEGLIKGHVSERIAVDGVYNSENDTYRPRPYLVFKKAVAAASLEYIENLDFKNDNLDSDVKLCIVNAIINSKDAHKLLNGDIFPYLVRMLEEVNPLEYKIDMKNTITVLEYIASNIKHFMGTNQSSYLSQSKVNLGKLEPKKALKILENLTSIYERLDNNDLIMAVYRITKCIKELDRDDTKVAYEII